LSDELGISIERTLAVALQLFIEEMILERYTDLAGDSELVCSNGIDLQVVIFVLNAMIN